MTALCWLVLLVMVETGVWLILHMRMSRRVREWAELNRENSFHCDERDVIAPTRRVKSPRQEIA